MVRPKPKRRSAPGKSAHPGRELMAALTKGMRAWGPASERPPILCHETLLPGLDRALQLGGWPLGTIDVLHGPPHGGKTLLAAALARSFQEAGNLVWFVDAERALDVHKWLQRLGVDIDALSYCQPEDFDAVLSDVTTILDRIRRGIKKGAIRPTMKFLMILDSLEHCVPAEIRAKILKTHKFQREQGRTQALYNKYFLSYVMPLVADLPFALAVITHETEVPGRYPNQPPTYRTKGGRHVNYEARVQVRVRFGGKVRVGDAAVAKRHIGRVVKNKVGFPDSEFEFYSATLAGAQRGVPWLDVGRTVFEDARRAGLLAHLGDGQYGGPALDGKRTREEWVRRLNLPEHLPERRELAAAVRATPMADGARVDDGGEQAAPGPGPLQANSAGGIRPSAAAGGDDLLDESAVDLSADGEEE